MRYEKIVWVALFVIAVLVTATAKIYPYFPGDLAVERWVQSIAGQNLKWAEIISDSAKFPWIVFIMAVVFAVTYNLGGWRMALASILSFMVMLVLGDWLGPFIARARPSPELVNVVKPLSGYSFPSLFALRYTAEFGFLAIVALKKTGGLMRIFIVSICVFLLIVGFFARVALAAHWPSDVIISYYIAIIISALVIRLTMEIKN